MALAGEEIALLHVRPEGLQVLRRAHVRVLGLGRGQRQGCKVKGKYNTVLRSSAVEPPPPPPQGPKRLRTH